MKLFRESLPVRITHGALYLGMGAVGLGAIGVIGERSGIHTDVQQIAWFSENYAGHPPDAYHKAIQATSDDLQPRDSQEQFFVDVLEAGAVVMLTSLTAESLMKRIQAVREQRNVAPDEALAAIPDTAWMGPSD